MKRILIFFTIVFLAVCTLSAKQIKLLAIGNSFSDDALEYYLHGLAAASDDEIIIGNMYIGGSSLELHYNNSITNSSTYSYRKIVNGVRTVTEGYNLANSITDENWDYISLQQVSQNSGQYSTYFPYLTNLVNYICSRATNPQMKLVIHSTWAYQQNSTHAGFANYNNDQITMYNAIIDASIRAAATAGIDIVIPAGTAIQNGRTSKLGDTFCRDGYHLELNYGRYTASCSWFEKLFQKSVVGNTFIPQSVLPFQAKVAQHAAHYAVEKPQEVTSLANLSEDDIITVPFTKKINVSFASTSQVGNWNLIGDYNANAVKENLRDTDGDYTDVSLVITKRFTNINSSGPTATTTEMNMPADVSRESFYGNTKIWMSLIVPLSEFKFTSLDVSAKYDLSFFASRMSATDNREAYYKVSGLEEADTTLYLNASNNASNIVKALAISPNNKGEIYVEVGPGPNNNNSYGFFYITALTINPKTPTGIGLTEEKFIKVFPNPFHDVLNVYADHSTKVIRIFNMEGREIFTCKNPVVNSWNQLSIGKLIPGIYLITTGKKKSVVVKK